MNGNFIMDIIRISLTFFGIIITIFKFNETIRASLRAESSWREELFNISSSFKVDKNHLLCLRAHQRFNYAHIKMCEISKKEYGDHEYGDKVRDQIGGATYLLYEKYILGFGKYKKITSEDQNKIRNLAIALLKYDFIKRGDNDNSIRFPLNSKGQKRNDAYAELSKWIDEYITT